MMPKKNWINNHLAKSILIISLIGIGFVFGLAWKSSFVISHEINPIEFLSLFVTLFLAYYVANILEKNREVNRGVKELFIFRIKDILEQIDKFNAEINSEEIKFLSITRLGKNIRKGIYSFFELSTKVDFTFEERLKSKINVLARELVIASTYTPPISANKTNLIIGLEIKENKSVLSEDKKASIVNNLDSLKDYLFTLQLAVHSK